MKKLSVIIPTFNVEQYLNKLLQILEGWADEIIICDSYSTDKTLEIAEYYGCKIIQHKYINSANQKNWAIPQASFEWVLIIDADELLEEQLKAEITLFLSKVPDEVDMAYIPRKNLMWGEWLKHASVYPDYQSRLFRKEKGRYQNKEVHAQVEVSGKCEYLKFHLIHDDYTSLSSWWMRNNRYFRYELDEHLKKGNKWGIKLQFIKPLYVFIRLYFIKQGFRHGFVGFLMSFQWLVYHFFVAVKLYEHQNAGQNEVKEKSVNPYG